MGIRWFWAMVFCLALVSAAGCRRAGETNSSALSVAAVSADTSETDESVTVSACATQTELAHGKDGAASVSGAGTASLETTTQAEVSRTAPPAAVSADRSTEPSGEETSGAPPSITAAPTETVEGFTPYRP